MDLLAAIQAALVVGCALVVILLLLIAMHNLLNTCRRVCKVLDRRKRPSHAVEVERRRRF